MLAGESFQRRHRRRPAADRRGRAVREWREQGRGRPGRAAGVGAARAGGGTAAAPSRFRPKRSQPRDSSAPTLLPVRMRTHSSRFQDLPEVPPFALARPILPTGSADRRSAPLRHVDATSRLASDFSTKRFFL